MANKIEVQLEVRNKASDEVKKFGKDAENTFNKARADAEKMNRSMSSSSDKFTAALNEIKSATSSVISNFSKLGSSASRQFTTMTGNVKDYKKSIDSAATSMKGLQTTASRIPAVTTKGGATGGSIPIVPAISMGGAGAMAGGAFAGALAGSYARTGDGRFQPRTSKKDYQGTPTGKKADVDQSIIQKQYTDIENRISKAVKTALSASQQLKDIQTRMTSSMAEYKNAAAGLEQWGNAKKRLIKYETEHATVMTNSNAAIEIMNSKMIQSWQTQNLVVTGLKKLGTAFVNIWKNIGIYIAAAGYGIMRFLGSSAREYEESIKAQSALQGVLRATGYTAGYTAEQMAEMAAEIQKTTGVSDDLITQAQAIIAVFQNIRGEEFKEVTKLAVDLSMVMGGDVKTAAEQLAKALQDPTEGLGALSKAGVKFTNEEKKAIEEMIKANDILKAQRFILDRVKSSVESVGEAYGKTDVGQIQIAIQAWKDMQESVGELVTTLKVALLPVIEEVTNAFKGAAMYISHTFGITLSSKIEALGVRLSSINEQIEKFEKLNKSGVKFFPEGWGGFGESTDVEEQLKTLYSLRTRLNTERTELLGRQNALRDLENKKAEAGKKSPYSVNLPDDKEGISKAEEAAKHIERILSGAGLPEREARMKEQTTALDQQYAEFAKHYTNRNNLAKAKDIELQRIEDEFLQTSVDELKATAEEKAKIMEQIKDYRFQTGQAQLQMAGKEQEAEIAAVENKYNILEKELGGFIDFSKLKEKELHDIKKKYLEKDLENQIDYLNKRANLYSSIAALAPTPQKGWRAAKMGEELSNASQLQSALKEAKTYEDVEIAYAIHTNKMIELTKRFEENRIAEDENWLNQFLYGVQRAEEAVPSWGETVIKVGREINDVMANNLSNAFIDFISRTKSAKDAFIDYAVNTTKWLLEIIAKQTILNALMSMNNPKGGGMTGGGGGFDFGSIFSMIGSIAGLQGGGMAAPGRPYVVGEKGPEIFVPNQAGRVLSNAQSANAMNAEPTVDVNIANIIDPAVMDAYVSSARGRNAILNVIGSNNRTVRRMVR